MADLLSLDKMRRYADNIRKLESNIRAIEQEIRCSLDEIDSCSQSVDATDTEEFLYKIHNYLRETYEICEAAEKFAKKLQDTSEVLSCTSPPFFDFIVNFDICAWWNQAYPIITQIATVTGAVTGTVGIATASRNFIKWVRSKLQENRNIDEYAWIRLILSEEEWSTSVLSIKLDLSKDEAKRILKGFGYKWNSSKMLYVSTEDTQKLRNIDIH